MKILAIEDEFAALAKMKAMLSDYGSCDVATCGKQALELIKKAIDKRAFYDLITIDIELPDIDGLSLVEKIIQVENSNSFYAQKIIVSASSTTENVSRASRSNCDGFLVKPVKSDVLRNKIISLMKWNPCQDEFE